jgi:hypothetical protein
VGSHDLLIRAFANRFATANDFFRAHVLIERQRDELLAIHKPCARVSLASVPVHQPDQFAG